MFTAFFTVNGVNLDIRLTGVLYWTRILLHVPIIHHTQVGCPHELCEARNVNVNSQIESKYHALQRLLTCLRVHKYLSMPCLRTSQYGKSGMLVKVSCDYTSMISHKTIAIFFYNISEFSVYTWFVYYIYHILLKRFT